MDVRDKIKQLGWMIRYVPHETIKDYNACYRVEYKGRIIHPPPADRLGIPLNEIWLSEALKNFEDYVLFHELREIQYRYEGYDGREAHLRARADEALNFCNDPKWRKMLEIFPDYTVPGPCLEELCVRVGGNKETGETLYQILSNCVKRNSPT